MHFDSRRNRINLHRPHFVHLRAFFDATLLLQRSISPDLTNGDKAVEDFLRGPAGNAGILGLSNKLQSDVQSSPTRAAIQREMRALEQELQARARARAHAQRKRRRQSPRSDHDRNVGDSPGSRSLVSSKHMPSFLFFFFVFV